MLLQLMVYAKIIYLLMVVISGALCTVEDYVIMSQCAHNKAIYLAAEGTVSVTDISQTQNITIVGRPDFVNNNFKIALYAKETQRYLCFNDHWKLVGMKELQDTCYFNEAIVHGYFVFRSVVDLHRRIGFTQRGRAVGPKKTVNDACYMFTKIPTDQFFHQHTHFSTSKTKTTTTTTKIPKTAHTRAPYTLNTSKINGSGTEAGSGSGNGSGSGRGSIRTKPNKRFKNHQRQNDTVSHYHSGSGSGSGSGGGSGNSDGNKKLKRQRNGNKPRRQKQEIQQQQLSGHNYILSNPKNNSYLNSSRKNLILSQNSLYNNNTNNYNNNNSYTNNKQNNNNSINNNNNNNNKHPPQSHQVRHHHNDPNKVARRQQHDQKLKTKQRQRLRPTTSTSYSSSYSPSPAASITITATVINSTKSSHSGLSTIESEIKPTSVTATISTTASANNNNTQSSTIVVSKRKSRRRKTDKLQKQLDYSKEQLVKGYSTATYTSSVEPTANEEDDEFTSSSTDYNWITNDIMLSSVKPTSASLPSWETWYPSLSTSVTDKHNGYSSIDSDIASASTPIDFYGNTPHYSTTLESSSTTDLNKNTLTLQTSVPLPTSMLTTTTLTDENDIDATISPSVTTDLGTITTTTITTNTSTYTQTDFWSTSINNDDNNDLLHTDIGDTDMQVTKELHSNYATPKLEDVHATYGLNTESFLEDINTSTSSQSNSKEETKSSIFETTVNANDPNNEAVEIERTTLDHEGDNTTPAGTRTTDAKTDASSIATDLHNCAYSTVSAYNERESTMKTTDCIYATKATGNIANYHSFRPQKNRKNVTTATTTAIAVTTTTTSTKLNTSLPKISQSSQTPSPRLITTLQQQSQTQIGNDLELKTATEVATTARTIRLNKSSALTPITTRRTIRKSTQRLLATPFHQLTYVRNEAGDIDIDSIDNISIYPEILDNESVDEPHIKTSTSRLTMISGYLPTSATVTLPESIRIAKIKINRERKRMLRLRNISNYT